MTTMAAFLGSILFGIIFDVPRRVLVPAGIAGAISWFAAVELQRLSLNEELAFFLATTIAGVYAEFMARYTRNPVSIFIVPAIIPLVPGAGAYYTVLYLVKGQLSTGLAKGMETFFLAGAIAVGVALVSVFFRIIKAGPKK